MRCWSWDSRLALAQPKLPATISPHGQSKQGNGKGLTVEDLGRGLKSAARNIEQEIPKIGPAIGNTFKNLTNKGSGKSESQIPSKGKK